MAETIFVDEGIPQIYGEIKGWKWWDNKKGGWSTDEKEYQKRVENQKRKRGI